MQLLLMTKKEVKPRTGKKEKLWEWYVGVNIKNVLINTVKLWKLQPFITFVFSSIFLLLLSESPNFHVFAKWRQILYPIALNISYFFCIKYFTATYYFSFFSECIGQYIFIISQVRSSKLAKHSKYAPADGNRYDGIYKVGKSICSFLLCDHCDICDI